MEEEMQRPASRERDGRGDQDQDYEPVQQPQQLNYDEEEENVGGGGQQQAGGAYGVEDGGDGRNEYQQNQHILTPKEVKILETADDIQERREQVLGRYSAFKTEAKLKREKLEDSRRFQYFKRDADELESWIYEKLQAASDETFKDATNLQAKIQKHQVCQNNINKINT